MLNSEVLVLMCSLCALCEVQKRCKDSGQPSGAGGSNRMGAAYSLGHSLLEVADGGGTMSSFSPQCDLCENISYRSQDAFKPSEACSGL